MNSFFARFAVLIGSMMIISSYVVEAEPAPAPAVSNDNKEPHTLCYPYWSRLQRNEEHDDLPDIEVEAKMYLENQHQVPSLLTSPNGVMALPPDGRSICEGASDFNSSSIAAYIWNGGIGEDPLATVPGWLGPSDTRNCHKVIKVMEPHALETKTKSRWFWLRVMDGRPMGIPASQPEVGCRQLWLTPAAFQAMGATAEEMASGKLILQWGYSKGHPPF